MIEFFKVNWEKIIEIVVSVVVGVLSGYTYKGMKIKNKENYNSRIKGNDNNATQIQTQNNYYQFKSLSNKKYTSNEIVREQSNEYIGDEKNKILKLNDIHIEILEMLRKNNCIIWENELDNFYKFNKNNEIAFTELIEYGYIKNTQIISGDKGCGYILNSFKKMEVLKILKEKNNILK